MPQHPARRRRTAWPILILLAAFCLISCREQAPPRQTPPTMLDPAGLVTTWPNQCELPEFERWWGRSLAFRENPMFRQRVKEGELPPVEARLPASPLVILPYASVGRYGGTLRGLSASSGDDAAETRSWRQVNLVRASGNGTEVMPEVAKSWEWKDGGRKLLFRLREGHKWSDGRPFTAEDVVFFMQDILYDERMVSPLPASWKPGGKPIVASAPDQRTVLLDFSEPAYGFLSALTVASMPAPFAPKHALAKYHGKYSSDATRRAAELGYPDWPQLVRDLLFGSSVSNASTLPSMPTLDSHIRAPQSTVRHHIYIANPFYFKVDSAGNQLPYIGHQQERFLSRRAWPEEIKGGNVDQKSQGLELWQYQVLKKHEAYGQYDILLRPSQYGPAIVLNWTHPDTAKAALFGDQRFRQALSVALNREEINKRFFAGLARPSQGLPLCPLVAPENQSASSEESYPPDGVGGKGPDSTVMTGCDQTQSAQLLDELGLPLHPKTGLRTWPDGKPLVLELAYATPPANIKGWPEYLAAAWKSVGITLRLVKLSVDELRKRVESGTLDLVVDWIPPLWREAIADMSLLTPPYEGRVAGFGRPWLEWRRSDGAAGLPPPAWVLRLWDLGARWSKMEPGSEDQRQTAEAFLDLARQSLAIIHTVEGVPQPIVVSRRLANCIAPPLLSASTNWMAPGRPEQWWLKEATGDESQDSR